MKHIKEMDDLMKDLEGLGFTHKYEATIFLHLLVNDNPHNIGDDGLYLPEEENIPLVNIKIKLPNKANTEDTKVFYPIIFKKIKDGNYLIDEAGKKEITDIMGREYKKELDPVLAKGGFINDAHKYENLDHFLDDLSDEFVDIFLVFTEKHAIHRITEERCYCWIYITETMI